MDLKNSLKTIKLHEPVVSAILGALVVLTIAFLAFNYFRAKTPGSLIPATSTENTPQERITQLPTKYTVKKGDHLWKIANDFYQSGNRWIDIARENKLKNPNILVVGQEITIPQIVASSQTTTTPQTLPNPPNSPKTEAGQTISGEHYTVAKGDSLWKISVRAYGDGFRWQQIAKLNHLKTPHLIYPNQNLKLPAK